MARATRARQLTDAGIKVWPSEGNFLLADFATAARAEAANAWLQPRGIIVRGMGAYGLPHCLRITVGTAEECTLVADALAAFMADGARMAEPLFRRLALLGIGLIGSSVARIARERGDLAAEVVANARTPETLDRVRELGIADRVEAGPGGGGRGRRLRHAVRAGRRLRRAGRGDRAASGAGRDPDRCRLHQAVGDPRCRAAGAGGRAFRAGASAGRHRVFRPGCRLHHAVPGPLVPADPAARHRRRLRSRRSPSSGAAAARWWRRWSRRITTGCWRSSAICRT